MADYKIIFIAVLGLWVVYILWIYFISPTYQEKADKVADDIDKHMKERRKNDPEYDAAAASFEKFLEEPDNE